MSDSSGMQMEKVSEAAKTLAMTAPMLRHLALTRITGVTVL